MTTPPEVLALLLALAIDLCFGEPPAPLHPVVWLGRYLGLGSKFLPGLQAPLAFAAGTLWWLSGAGLLASFVWLLQRQVASQAYWIQVIALALLLKPLFGFRVLLQEVAEVEKALARSLEEGRRRLSRIVSRETERLSAAEVRESALESLSENLSDSVLAPLFWFFLGGLPAAALYRYANTADAMWGYRGKWEWAGKWAALVDDVLNYFPARITAVLLCLLGPKPGAALRALPGEAKRTPSPNSGWPMAALALTQKIRLGKPGVYTLNPTGPAPAQTHTRSSLRQAALVGVLAFLLASLGSWILG